MSKRICVSHARSWALFNVCCSYGYQKLQIHLISFFFHLLSWLCEFPLYCQREPMPWNSCSQTPLLEYAGPPSMVVGCGGGQAFVISRLSVNLSAGLHLGSTSCFTSFCSSSRSIVFLFLPFTLFRGVPIYFIESLPPWWLCFCFLPPSPLLR